MVFTFLLLVASIAQALRFDPTLTKYNLNTNQQAVNPLDYSGQRLGHKYHPSPDNWRFPFYTLFLDRFVNGDPSNDNANGTLFEQDIFSNQLRHGGDLQGLIDTLDYIQGMGIKGVYIAGSPFINLPWGADSYSPLDLTLLDFHYGDIALWQKTIDEIHQRGMYVVMDHTMATMGDLIGFDGFLNESTPFDPKEHKVLYKSDRQYHDFSFGNNYNTSCDYPRFWNETGFPIDAQFRDELKGCFNSDFDQYGDIEAFGVHPDFQRQLAKFASVQDRLREWVPSVRQRLEVFSCLTMNMLDIDGYRFDKAVQVTVDAQGDFSESMRQCASKLGKKNFFMPGEITGGNTLGSIYIGRGRQPNMKPKDLATAINLTDKSDSKLFLRDKGKNALDAGAFHYSVYRFLTRFLGMSGNLEAGFDLPPDWVDAWNEMILTNDLVNANTGKFDPRHMLGVVNQDNFRWPAIVQGIERELLGFFITTLHMPGIPLLYYGQEQGLYVLDNTAENYIFGRQPFSPSPAWKLHGCYSMGSTQYKGWPIDQGRKGCQDDGVALDHRDPSHPMRNILKHMFHMRENYPALSEGWLLQKLGNKTDLTVLEGSGKTPTERGIWGVARAFFPGIQSRAPTGAVWLVYHNRDTTTDYSFNCDNNDTAFIAPFDEKTVVKNLFYPFDEITLESSDVKLGFNESRKPNGCISKITMQPFEYRAYVQKSLFVGPPPMITKFSPGHDASINSADAKGSVDISIHFSQEMDCDGVTDSISIASTIEGNGGNAEIDNSTVKCTTLSDDEKPPYVGAIGSKWSWSAKLQGVSDGIHSITVKNATNKAGSARTGANDKFLIRVGAVDNPVVFPLTANYSKSLLTREGNDLFVNHKAAGASQWRYSTNWGSSWSDWTTYTGGKQKIDVLPWSGTKRQEWSGDHVMVQYFSRDLGSSSLMQQGDSKDQPERRFPHIFIHGTFNKFGFDAGLKNDMKLQQDGTWEMHFMDEWPSSFQINVWGINPDGKPDQTYIMGDVDNDTVTDRLPPNALAPNFLNATRSPASPALSYKLRFNDADRKFELIPSGNRWWQLILFILLGTLPVVGGLFAVWIFMGSFYKVKINKVGFKRRGRSPFRKAANRLSSLSFDDFRRSRDDSVEMGAMVKGGAAGAMRRRTVLIATMEYNIDDWNIKIKIGGLGVMAQLMGKALEHQDLIWVVPCVGGIDYPIDQRAEPMYCTIMGKDYEIEVQYHQVNNITYVLLDAPIFRKQTKADPYPPRMDDIESAIYYSAWNYCIAETIRRFPIDLYHINDYHGAAAPLYLLPERTIPCALSLHNAEFQGMWPMRNPEESKEVCDVFNLDPDIVKEYVQFGSVFNLLHAGASYLRVHQRGFGAVGVSKKYGDRSYARYPIFWGLSKIGQLPNPDPSDTAEWNRDEEMKEKDVTIDQEFESKRGELRKQAQEWAGLEINPNAELFVFVGRWSLQKGVDLIADIFPSILEKYPTTQLICIGPVIDLYGKFAALKLSKLMEKYPKRVYSKPEFTALPPYIFSGAEFALIPSRDEPFGLVAVEFGRKGALGVGARVGGLGQMPGYWYTIESTAPQHLLHQFRGAIVSALDSKQKTRVKMRAWSAKQRFPVAQWLEDLEKLQSEAIRIHTKEAKKKKRITSGSLLTVPSNINLNENTRYFDDASDAEPSPPPSTLVSRTASPRHSRASSLSVPFLTEEHSRSRSASNPEPDEADLSGPLLPPNPFYASSIPDNRGSSDSLATIVARSEGNRQSVDSFAFRMMAPDGASRPNSTFGLNPQARGRLYQQRNSSRLSVIDVVGERTDYKLQKVDPFFTDSTGEFYRAFESKLNGLTAKNSDTDLCIEDYLTKSEKEWFTRFRDARLGRSRSPSRSPAPSLLRKKRHSRNVSAVSINSIGPSEDGSSDDHAVAGELERDDEFLLGSGYKPPKGIKKFLQLRLGDWPIYSFLLGLGQIIAANSYQIVLLTGEVGQTATKLYMVAGTYGGTTILWWFLFRRFKSLYTLSLPWFFYGLAFMLLGISPFISSYNGRGIMQDVATIMYATAASTGSIFFSVNFGDEGGAPISTWIFRACVIQGIQQVYVVALWYWGSILSKSSSAAAVNGVFIAGGKIPEILVITVPIAIVLWAVGVVLFIGLPDYYRQSPDKIPSFYGSLLRRHIVPWFFLTVVVQNYWLSAPYGRNWEFLFYSQYIPGWATLLLAVGFFVVLWALLLYGFSFFSKSHPWIVPIFSIGLGAPRWAQMLWGTSGVGLYLPWAGGAVGSAIISRCLWLWLGLLDTIQGVGLGMVLLLTLTRQHVAATLMGAQVLGSVATILARATSPNKIGPGDVFPDFSEGVMPGIGKVWFWVALGMQLILPIGFFKFFRKEQVAKP